MSDYLKTVRLERDRGSAVGRVLVEGKTVHIPDALADPDYKFLDVQKRAGFRTMLGVPLMREGTPIGIALLMRDTVRPFNESQIDLVETFADQAVIAIENVRLFDEVQARTAELADALQQQTATAEVLKVISRSAFDLNMVLQTLVERLPSSAKRTRVRSHGNRLASLSARQAMAFLQSLSSSLRIDRSQRSGFCNGSRSPRGPHRPYRGRSSRSRLHLFRGDRKGRI